MKAVSIYFITLCLIVSACNNEQKLPENINVTIDSSQMETKKPIAIDSPKSKPPQKIETTATEKTFTCALRPNEKLNALVLFSDQVKFIEYNDDGDYMQLNVEKNKQLISLYYNWEHNNTDSFAKNELIDLQWKIDSAWIAGDGERLEMHAWAVKATRTKK